MIETHYTDKDGRPEGGTSSGLGFTIAWQRGPCRTPEDRNGAFLIEVLESCVARLDFYQSGEFACEENAIAMASLGTALHHLKKRRDRRRDAGTLGTHEPDVLPQNPIKLLDNGLPRRCRVDLYTPAERAISDAIDSVEEAGAHELLTKAVVLLGEAKDAVSDYVEQGEV